ncbi:HNH endonuclease [Roseomonas sp. 573]|uniref:HNH endonuclease n=2 Tax=Roseomonas haemaphysalidis TaxID=2768162 RepID=A0ABS3KW76_9PROT|nr:HNH endonuclease [Roseomonas haemaphysalidis]MBO1081728.1 HNH endonuclease [Roseomonas haemaphysalidis]
MLDAREKVLREIKARRGQKAFRDQLLKAYDGRCAISGCAVLDVLEAVHIVPYRGDNTNHPINGLLLRADLHTLFDCGLIAIDPDTLKVLVASAIKDPSYREFHGHMLRRAIDLRLAPSLAALRHHRKAALV